MPTVNPRLNITLLPEVAKMLAQLAKQEGKSVSSFAKELMLDALEQREDIALSKLADLRDKEQIGKRLYSHEEAWR